MLRRLTVVAGGFGLLLVWGCSRRAEPPPQFNHAMSAFSGAGGRLMPIRLPASLRDKSILKASSGGASTGAGEREAAAAAPEAQPTKIEIDDSTPEGVVQAYVKIWTARQISQLASILVPKQAEACAAVTEAMQSWYEMLDQINRLMDEKFPGHAPLKFFALPTPDALTVAEVKVDPANQEQAEAKVQMKDVPEPIALRLQRVDGRWRVQDPLVQQFADEPEWAENTGILVPALRQVLSKIESGEIAQEADATDQLLKAMKSAVAAAHQQKPAGPKQATTEQPKKEQPQQNKPKPAQRRPGGARRDRSGDEDVDHTVEPGYLRRGR